ncbi:AAA family ATPase [uncultured Acetobacteroides sp.]|uniref:AAA family ATPase n=1 Tax=uncultured Acetobacteroides sp. TaxID=1760811 RepID=UPI0029F5C1D1|nr:AAA family ATPase [uncultured Acetobacteroides sp.]
MKLDITADYKSLNPFSIELPKLTILTGLNGAGKSQILEAISNNIIKIFDNDKELTQKKYTNLLSLMPIDNGASSKEIIVQRINSSFTQFQNLQNSLKNFTNNFSNSLNYETERPIYSNLIGIFGTSSLHTIDPDILKKEIEINFPNNPDYKSFLNKYMSNYSLFCNQMINNHYTNKYQKNRLNKIKKETNKDIHQLTLDDFHKCLIHIDNNNTDLFQHNLAETFKRYHLKYENNLYNKFRSNELKNKDIVWLTDEDFTEKYGEAPWILLNKILSEANLNYKVNTPENQSRDVPFGFKLIDNSTEVEISINDLSSGEKVIMSLVLALLNTSEDEVLPEIILMDEPDASLHPSMTKQFLNVINNVFVKEKGITTIITTHSPTTVALAPEESLYVVSKSNERIKKTTKEKALKTLLDGVPSISINYENRRQVFVESKYDVFFYEKVYQKIRSYLHDDISLHFISSGTNGSGCSDQVKEIVKKLNSFGNKSIFGIIDWDCKNVSKDNILVLGENKRYSIENYIFDPILITAFLLREKFITRDDLGLTKNESFTDFKNLSQDKLQQIADYTINRVKSKINPSEGECYNIKYINDTEIKIPIWYLQLQGHDLEEKLKEEFHQLKKYNKEGELKNEIINKIIDDIPELIPHDLLDVFLRIQSN